MALSVWPLLFEEELPAAVREALKVATYAASETLSAKARRLAACGLMKAFGLSAAEACELLAV